MEVGNGLPVQERMHNPILEFSPPSLNRNVLMPMLLSVYPYQHSSKIVLKFIPELASAVVDKKKLHDIISNVPASKLEKVGYVTKRIVEHTFGRTRAIEAFKSVSTKSKTEDAENPDPKPVKRKMK